MKRTHHGMALLVLVCSSANATLESRLSGQAYYDTTTNLTWVADANLAMTSGYDVDGRMDWLAAQAWIAALNTANYLGKNDWRLPTAIDTGPAGCDFGYTGTDCGYNVDLATGEMARLYYGTLGNTGYYTTSSGNGFCPGVPPNWPGCLTNPGPFANIKAGNYWTGTEYALNTDEVWTFNFDFGSQFNLNKIPNYYAWAVRTGDIVIVPLPDAVDDGPISVIDGVARIIPVGGNDTGFTDPVTVTVTTLPTKGTINTISPTGPAAGMTITYTANSGSSGADSFVYAMTDSTPASDFATVTVDISLDTDGDGIVDSMDNCQLTPNPLQQDVNGDGYGNICDADLNNSGTVTTADFGLLRSVLGQSASSSPTAAAADLNGSGTVTTADFGLLRVRLGTAPGPSGLSCAGTIPCPGP